MPSRVLFPTTRRALRCSALISPATRAPSEDRPLGANVPRADDWDDGHSGVTILESLHVPSNMMIAWKYFGSMDGVERGIPFNVSVWGLYWGLS